MKNVNTISTFTNVLGGENLGPLRVDSQAYDNFEDAGMRRHVRRKGLTTGYPGFRDRRTMSDRQIEQYLAFIDSAPPGRNGLPVRMQQVSIYHEDGSNDLGELVGFTVYGSSMTPGGVISRQKGRKSAHVPTFSVVRERQGGGNYSPAEMRAIGLALGFGALTDMVSAGYDEVSRNVEATLVPGVLAEVKGLGLQFDLEQRGVIPDFPVEVVDPEGMARFEYVLGPLTRVCENIAASPFGTHTTIDSTPFIPSVQ